jgi:hypothetical protein
MAFIKLLNFNQISRPLERGSHCFDPPPPAVNFLATPERRVKETIILPSERQELGQH